MKKLLILASACLAMASCSESEPAKTPSGSLELIGNWAPEGLSRRDVWVWTPAGYDTAQTYPVLFAHDGQMLFDSTTTWNHQEWELDETMNRLIAEGKIRPAIVVGIANGEKYRYTDYLPSVSLNGLSETERDSLVDEHMEGKSRSDRYLHFLTAELKPYIQKHYSASEKPSDYFLMGSSMGGLISLYAVTEYPQHFGGAACISTHWPCNGDRDAKSSPMADAYFDYLSTHLPNPYASKLYFDHGTDGLDSLYAPYQAKMDSILEANGFKKNVSYMSEEFEGATHDEKSWAARLDIPLTFLLGKK